jgi:hypothetical protein
MLNRHFVSLAVVLSPARSPPCWPWPAVLQAQVPSIPRNRSQRPEQKGALR